MAERYFQITPHASLDGDFRLHYGPNESKILHPCTEITDVSLKIGIVDNNRINPRRLLLVDKDRQPITVYCAESGNTREVSYPGKSAFIELDKTKSGRALVNSIVSNILSGTADRRDHLHYASVQDISYAGWHTFWAPLQNAGKVFHTRLVADRTILYNEDPSENDAESLARAFCKSC